MILRFAVLPLLFILLMIEIAGGVLRAPFLSWNEIRLCRSMAILRGLPLYPGKDALGPVIGTLHTPVSHLFYTAAAYITDPTIAVLAASLMAVLAVFVPLAWVIFRAGPQSYPALCFLFAAFLIIQSNGTYHVLFFVHADAPAVGFATIACGLLARPGAIQRSTFWMSGLACALSLACKQTMAPVIIGIAAYLFLAYGWKAAAHFLSAAAAAGALLLAAILTAWPARDVLFNIWTLASARPLKPAPVQILMDAYRSTRLDLLPALMPLLFIAAYQRRKIFGNRWTVFALCGVCMIPVSLKAMITIGSAVNHPGVVLYFFFVAAALAIQQHLKDENPALQLSARLFLAIGILVSLAPGMLLTLKPSLANLRNNPMQMAVAYSQRHPGRAYFPWNPMAGLVQDHRLYHVDPAVYDREAVHFPLTQAQLQSGLPQHFDVVAIPPGEILSSKALLDLTHSYHQTADPELPAWTILAK